MKVIQDGLHILVSGVINGGRIPLALLGLENAQQIHRIWTILDLALLLPAGTSLGEAKPKHHVNAFLEDRMHDWYIHNGELRYGAHSSESGEAVSILIQLVPNKIPNL